MKSLCKFLLPAAFILLTGCIHPPITVEQYAAPEDLEISQKEKLLSELKEKEQSPTGLIPGSVGVLNFEEMSSDVGLGLAATEFFTANLGLFDQFTLIDMSYSAVLAEEYQNYSPDIKRVLLEAEQMVSGRVGMKDGVLVIDSDLIPTYSNNPTDLATLRGHAKDFFRLVADLNIKFLEKNNVTVSKEIADQLYQIPTEDLVAYILYARGRNSERLGNYAEALQYYQSAAKKDPKFKKAKERIDETKEKMKQPQPAEQAQKNVLTDVPDTSPNIVEEESVPGLVGNSRVLIEINLPQLP